MGLGSMGGARARAPVAVALALGARLAAAGELQVTFERIVGTGDPLPGRSETFSSFHTPALDGDRVGFLGDSVPPGPSGIHVTSPAGLVTLADTETQIPGAPPGQTFVGFSNPSLSEGLVAFTGARDVSGFRFEGVVLHDGEELIVVARNGDEAPGSPPATFLFFFTVSLDAGAVGFAAGTTRGWEVDSTLGGLHVVARESMPIPGTGFTFGRFGFNPTYQGRAMGFTGETDFPLTHEGVYAGESAIERVADVLDPIPGGAGNFTEFLDGPTIRAGRVVFRARGAGGQLGIYLRDGGSLARIADRTTPIPDGTGAFTDLDAADYEGPSLDRCGNVAFEGLGAGGQKGLYARLGPPIDGLAKVVDLGDEVNGQDLVAVAIGRESFDEGKMVFVAGFADGTGGIYLATLRFADGTPVCPAPLFADGFESGDTTAWSATQP